jgi:hypothetical protein
MHFSYRATTAASDQEHNQRYQEPGGEVQPVAQVGTLQLHDR